MRRSKFPFRPGGKTGGFFGRTPGEQVLTISAACISIVLIPFFIVDHLNTATVFNIPAGFFLITLISPIILSIIVYLFSRKQAANDLQLDDET